MTTHPTATERAECVRLYSEGALQKQLAEIFRRPDPTIRQWIKKANAQRGHKFRGQWLTLSSPVRAGGANG
jgi:transposase-like protein